MLGLKSKARALLAREGPVEAQRSAQVATKANFQLANDQVDLSQLVLQLEPEQLYTFPCEAKWSMHHMLQYLVKEVGPAQVWLCSWTITETPMRAILRMMDDKMITRLRCVFDERVRKHNANAAQLAIANIAEIGFTGIHAKCMVVIGAERSVTVCATANITRNKRIELYWLSTHREIAVEHAEWIDDVLSRSQRLAP